MSVQEWAKRLNWLYEEKDRLEEEVKANNQAIAAAKKNMAEAMVDDDCDATSVDGYSFRLVSKTYYTKKSDDAIWEAGVDYFTVLRASGLGDVIKETVNPRTLQSAVRAYAEQYGELSEDLAKVINVYTDDFEIERRKAKKPAAKAADAPEPERPGPGVEMEAFISF